MRKLCAASLFLIIACSVALAKNIEYVKYNPQSHIYHKLSCPSAKTCKKCVTIDKQAVIKKGGRACKRCGG